MYYYITFLPVIHSIIIYIKKMYSFFTGQLFTGFHYNYI